MTAIIDLSTVSLSSGSHDSESKAMCINELVSLLAGEVKTDRPACMCPVIAEFTMTYNDGVSQEVRDRVLLPFAVRLASTRSTPDVELRRAFICADYAVRVFAAGALVRAGLPDTLSCLHEVVDEGTAAEAASRVMASMAASETAAKASRAAAETSRAASEAAAETASMAAAMSMAMAARAASEAAAETADAAVRATEADVIRLLEALLAAGEPQ